MSAPPSATSTSSEPQVNVTVEADHTRTSRGRPQNRNTALSLVGFGGWATVTPADEASETVHARAVALYDRSERRPAAMLDR